MIYPATVTVVAFLFAGIVLNQFRLRHKPYQLVWFVSLLLGGLAGLCFLLFLAEDRNASFFRLYYACGALLMAPYLGLGSIYLLAPRRAANAVAAVLIPLSLAGLLLLLSTPLNAAALHGSNVEAGTKLVSGPAVVFIAVLNTFGAVAVVGGACLSGWRVWRRQGPVRLLLSNLCIAAGTILASLAGTLARVTGNGSAFWLLLATGFLVLFTGFLLTTARARSERPLSPATANRPSP